METAANGFDNLGKELTREDLQCLTSNFSPHNYIGRTQFGVLYRGIIPEGCNGMRSGVATIKMWKNERFITDFSIVEADPIQVRFRMEQELRFLQQPEIAIYPYTVNVMGYCFEDDYLGVVYDLKPLETLRHYINNENFGWLKRVNVALKLASLLKFFHQNVPLYIVRNLSAAHVMLDQDLNPIVIDYAMIHGGSCVDLLTLEQGAPWGSLGYTDREDISIGIHTRKTDVYAYGVLLLELLGRCTFDCKKEVMEGEVWKGMLINTYVLNEYIRQESEHAKIAKHAKHAKRGKSKFCYPFVHRYLRDDPDYDAAKRGKSKFCYSFAHQYLRDDPDYEASDGNVLTMMALRCATNIQRPPPTIGDIMKELEMLNLVQSHPELLEEK